MLSPPSLSSSVGTSWTPETWPIFSLDIRVDLLQGWVWSHHSTRDLTSQSFSRERNILQLLKVLSKTFLTVLMTHHYHTIHLKKHIHAQCWNWGKPFNRPESRLKVVSIEIILSFSHQFAHKPLPVGSTLNLASFRKFSMPLSVSHQPCWETIANVSTNAELPPLLGRVPTHSL